MLETLLMKERERKEMRPPHQPYTVHSPSLLTLAISRQSSPSCTDVLNAFFHRHLKMESAVGGTAPLASPPPFVKLRGYAQL